MQPMLLRAVGVIRALLGRCPVQAVKVLLSWRLEDSVGGLERRVKAELSECLAAALALGPPSPWTADAKASLRLLLDRLVEAGHEGALDVTRRMAQQVRSPNVNDPRLTNTD